MKQKWPSEIPKGGQLGLWKLISRINPTHVTLLVTLLSRSFLVSPLTLNNSSFLFDDLTVALKLTIGLDHYVVNNFQVIFKDRCTYQSNIFISVYLHCT